MKKLCALLLALLLTLALGVTALAGNGDGSGGGKDQPLALASSTVPDGSTDVPTELSVTLTFNKNDFPYFILWKTQRPNGDIYVSGMEPAVNFPNTRSFEKKNGRLVPIAPKETKTFCFEFNVLSSEQEVDGFVKGVESLQSSATSEVIPSPVPEWCE